MLNAHGFEDDVPVDVQVAFEHPALYDWSGDQFDPAKIIEDWKSYPWHHVATIERNQPQSAV